MASVPHAFLCPISLELMRVPVVAADGHTYERSEISAWLQRQTTSPLTNLPLPTHTLVPNIALQKAIEEWGAANVGGALCIHPSRVSVSQAEVIGEGCFGRVLGATLDGVARVAVKTMPAMTREQQREQAAAEARVHLAAQQAAGGVCALIGTMDCRHGICLVMRRYERSLADYIRRSGPLPDSKIRSMGHSLCCTLAELHDAGIILQDIKPANVLLDSYDRPVFSDFGIASIGASAVQTSVKGTFNYMAPEAFDPPLGLRSDMWSIACLLLEMHTGRVPWEGMQMQQIVSTVLVKRHTPLVPATMPAAPVVRRCFAFVAAERPCAAALALALCPVHEAERREAECEATLAAVLNASEASKQKIHAKLASVERECASEIGRATRGGDDPIFDERRVDSAIAGHDIRVVVVYGPAGSGRHELATVVVRALHGKHGLADISVVDCTYRCGDAGNDVYEAAHSAGITVFILENNSAYSVSRTAWNERGSWKYGSLPYWRERLERRRSISMRDASRGIVLLCTTQMYLHPGQWALHAPHRELTPWVEHVNVQTSVLEAMHVADAVSVADIIVTRAAAAHDDKLVDAATGAIVDCWLGRELDARTKSRAHPAKRGLPYVV